MDENLKPIDAIGAALVRAGGMVESIRAPHFKYSVECVGADGRVKWVEEFDNLVTDAGANDLLDKYFSGSTYTAAWYVGLISSASYTGIAAGDTMASHAGWTEASTNQPTYSQATRPALAFSAAASRSKATSAASAFSITGTGTAKGAFIASNNTKGGTTGILYSAGLFSGGDRAVINGDTINVSATLSLT